MSIPEKKYMTQGVVGPQCEFDDLEELVKFVLVDFFKGIELKDIKLSSTCLLWKEKKEETDLSIDSVKRFLDDQDGEICMKAANGCGVRFIWTREAYKKIIDERNASMEKRAEDLYEDQSISAFDGTKVQGKKKREKNDNKLSM